MREVVTSAAFAMSPIFMRRTLDLKHRFKPYIGCEPIARIADMFDKQLESTLFQPLLLPNGQIVPNRIAKAAMEENMADRQHLPGAALRGLYRHWGAGGAGMLITGNVM